MSVPQQKEIILAESDPLLADITAFRLELLGYQLRIVGSISLLNAAIGERIPDILVLDTCMPDGDGVECVARLRTQYTESQLPILVFSIDPSLETVERAFLAGAQDYLITPFDPTVLEEKIHDLLEQPTIKITVGR